MEEAVIFNILKSIMTLVVAYYAHKFIMKSINKFLSTFGKEVKAPKTLSFLIGLAVYGISVLVILSIWKVDLAPALAGLGVSGLVFGLAFQEPLTNFLSGVLVLSTRKVFEGEVVEVGGIPGVVDQVRMNSVHLITFDGKLVIIPNKSVWNDRVIKYWPGPYRRVDIDVTIDYNADHERAIKVLKSVLEENELVVKDPDYESTVVFNKFDNKGVVFTVRFWTSKETFFDTVNSVALGIKRKLDENKINIPFDVIEIRKLEGELKINKS